MTARHDKATVDQAIADVRGYLLKQTCSQEHHDALAALRVLADAVEEAERFREKRCIAHAAVEVLNGDCPICDTKQAEERAEAAEAESDWLAARVAELDDLLRGFLHDADNNDRPGEGLRDMARAALARPREQQEPQT